MKSVFATRTCVLLVLLPLAACASGRKHIRLYAGPERASEEIAELRILESLEVRSINGEDVPRIPRVSRSGERRLDLLPGRYDIVAYYDDVWQLNSSEQEAVRSEPQLLSLELEAGHTYRLEHRSPIDLDDARLLARDMKLSIVDLSSGQPIALAAESRPSLANTAVVVNPIPPREEDATATGAPEAESSRGLSALELLKFWWQQASQEQRARFRSWIED